MFAQWVNKLSEELSRPLPGVDAQLRLSPPERYLYKTEKPVSQGAVLVVLYPVNHKIFTVFIKRNEYEGVHSGQVSLPGGKYEVQDKTLRNTALRETREETGIDESDISILGSLTSLHIPVSSINVFPFVGYCKCRPQFFPDPVEVRYIIETSLDDLLNPDNQKHKIMQVGEREIEIPYFDIQGDHIWGATAMIISEFLEIIKKI